MEKEIHAAVHDVVEELSVLGVLHDHENIIGCFDDFIELGDGGMPDHFEDVQLACDSFDIGDIFDFIFLEDLDRNWFLSWYMGCFFYLSEGSPADSRSVLPQKYSIR